jgi:maltose alpha-D-glucosyltransferase / alpha-amylase
VYVICIGEKNFFISFIHQHFTYDTFLNDAVCGEIMQQLREHLTKLYPGHEEKILNELGALPAYPHKHDHVRAIYVTYADAFSSDGKPGTLDTLRAELPRIKALGCNAIHILPPFKSPMIDGGFDISDYYHIREELGGDGAFERFLVAAREEKIIVFIDLVLNHVSEEHEWFIKAKHGDKHYQQFFVHTATKPHYIGPVHKDGAAAKYLFPAGETTLRIIFPEQAGPIPHFHEEANGWYYHTFYPQQIDVDWNNPEVFIAFAKILMHWASLGLSFRLDAVPFIGKDIWNGITEATDRCHHLVTALHHIATAVHPRCQFLVEAALSIQDTVRYFGDTVPEADFAYHFNMAAGMWTSLVTTTAEHSWKIIHYPVQLPAWAEWVTFLRNHDTFAYKMVPPPIDKTVEALLKPRGLLFAKGNEIAGRISSLLAHDTRHIILAHALLASIPGIPAIYYGDEFGKPNDFANMTLQTTLKQQRVSAKVVDDARDINRGYVTVTDRTRPNAPLIAGAITMLLAARKQHVLRNPVPVAHTHPQVFSAHYEKLIVLCNLSAVEHTVPMKAKHAVVQLNGALYRNGISTLPAYGVLWLEK